MTPITPAATESTRNRALPLAPQIGIAILLLLAPLASHAQSPATKLANLDSANEKPSTYKTFYLNNVIRQQDANEIVTDLRNILPTPKIYYVPSQNALSIRGSADDIALAQKILGDLDHPHKAYRLTYTLTETGSGQPDGDRMSRSSPLRAAPRTSSRAAKSRSSPAPTRMAVSPRTQKSNIRT
jgi:hypothetical protein